MHYFALSLVSLVLMTSTPAFGLTVSQRSLELPSGHEVLADVYGSTSKIRVLWIGPNYSLHPRHQQVARDLANKGMQVWQTDLAEALFLPRGAQSMRDIPATVVAELIQSVSANGRYKVLIVSDSYGAIPSLRGVHAWQASQPHQRSIVGVILFSPYLYAHVPTLGESPQLVGISSATSVPVYIFQAEKNANRGHLPAMVKQLQRHAPVYTEVMQGVTALFYKEDKSAQTLSRLKTVAGKIKKVMSLLSSHLYPLKAIALPKVTLAENKLGLDDRLKTYQGQIQAQTFSLQDVNHKLFTLDDFKGKVSVINFWASWCPPCVEEIPSLNRLRYKMQGKPFQLISINYAESAERIKLFMKKVAVDFPVLLDPGGTTASNWKVVAFPSTFIIGPDGRIQYGVNAAIDWDTDDVISQLNALLK